MIDVIFIEELTESDRLYLKKQEELFELQVAKIHCDYHIWCRDRLKKKILRLEELIKNDGDPTGVREMDVTMLRGVDSRFDTTTSDILNLFRLDDQAFFQVLRKTDQNFRDAIYAKITCLYTPLSDALRDALIADRDAKRETQIAARIADRKKACETTQ